MPQLDIFAFLAELFWLFVFFGLFFYVILIRVLPNIYYVFRLRNQFHKLGVSDEKGIINRIVSTEEANQRLETLGGRVITVYDLALDRLSGVRNIATTKLYEFLFIEYAFSSFYAFRRICLYLALKLMSHPAVNNTPLRKVFAASVKVKKEESLPKKERFLFFKRSLKFFGCRRSS